MGVDQNKRFSLFSNKDMIIRHNTKKRHLQIQAYDMNAHPSPSLAAPITLLSRDLIILLVHLLNSQQQDLF